MHNIINALWSDSAASPMAREPMLTGDMWTVVILGSASIAQAVLAVL